MPSNNIEDYRIWTIKPKALAKLKLELKAEFPGQDDKLDKILDAWWKNNVDSHLDYWPDA